MRCAFGLSLRFLSAAALVAVAVVSSASHASAADAKYESLFDGKTLDNWDGDSKFWRVEDGTITGETTETNKTDGNTFIIWRGGEVGDFDLRLEYKIVNGNSGIQYRSFEVPDKKWVVGGYQGDFEAGDKFSGINYGERFRGILAERGQETVIGADSKPTVVGTIGDSNDIQSHIKKEDWNVYQITARGFRFEHRINGYLTAVVTDEDKDHRRATGILALQLHAGPAMKVQFKNIKLKKLDKETAQADANAKQIAFIAGRPSHGYGDHEHRAGCLLLAEAINKNVPGVIATVYEQGWPRDPSVLEDASAIVIYSDGGGGHPFVAHLPEIDHLMKKGVGLVCIHYAVEVPKGEPGEKFLEWTGGYFETDWSVNPHWTANFKSFGEHPIGRGVKPFTINDEWYYHMRFRENMEGVTPILTDVPPASTLERPDGSHSGNPFVRAEAGKPQHVAWATERPDGGRGFGFTGGHVHWNWGNDNHRKLVLNAIAWAAGLDVPTGGVPSESPSYEDLAWNLDKPVSGNHNEARIRKLLEEWQGGSSKLGGKKNE